MGFAEAYLRKAGLREALIEPEPHSGLLISVNIPVYNESGLERCLDSLFQCTFGSPFHAEVLILINAPAEAPEEVLKHNQSTLERTRTWIADHPHPSMDFYVMLDHSFGKKEAGVGTARKVLMDEAVRRFSQLDRSEGIITCMDADATVQHNYLDALVEHFMVPIPAQDTKGSAGQKAHGPRSEPPEACSIRFAHPLSGEEYSEDVYAAIAQYELHLRYYLQSLRSTGYPNAYHTVGSSLAVRADIYCLEGGMNRRQAGEDFYFIQKLAQRGNYSECNDTCVMPSPRPSDRVPFGTGLAVSRLLEEDVGLSTYHPEPFRMLQQLFKKVDSLYDPLSDPEAINTDLSPILLDFLKDQKFAQALSEIKSNSASLPAFRKRFWRWFNMFRIMKFLHFAREVGYPDVPVNQAASKLLQEMDPSGEGIPSLGDQAKKLLLIYRMLDARGATLFPQ